jgi:hypothetical protein
VSYRKHTIEQAIQYACLTIQPQDLRERTTVVFPIEQQVLLWRQIHGQSHKRQLEAYTYAFSVPSKHHLLHFEPPKPSMHACEQQKSVFNKATQQPSPSNGPSYHEFFRGQSGGQKETAYQLLPFRIPCFRRETAFATQRKTPI